MSEVVKISYRTFGGFLFLSFIFLFASTSFVFLIGGLFMITFSFLILIYPKLVELVPIWFIETRITDPYVAFLMSIIIGTLVVLLGLGFYILTIKSWNYGLRLDRGISKYVDLKVKHLVPASQDSKKSSVQSESQDKISKLERLTNLK